MRALFFGLAIILATLEVRAADTNSLTGLDLKRPQLEKEVRDGSDRKSNFLRLFDNRLNYTFTNSFGVYRMIEFEREQDKLGKKYSEYLAGQVKKAFTGSARLTLRQFALEEIPIVYDAKTSWASAIRNTLTGYEEKENPVSPLNLNEGMPAQEGLRQPKGFKAAWRPLRTDPYVSVSYGKYDTDKQQRIFTTSLRLYADDWYVPRSDLIAELPLAYGFILSSGVSVKPLEEDRLKIVEGKMGLVKIWRRGELYLGGSYPLGFMASLGYKW